MRETGEGDSTPSKRGDCLCERRAEGKEILNSTSTTYGATERLRLDDDDLRLFTTRAVLGGGGGGPPRFAGSSPDHTLRSHQFPRTPLIFLLPGSLRSLASMSDPQHQPNPTASVYALRYLCLLDILRDERATEPRLNTAEPAEWLNWAHATRWLIVSGQSLVPSAPCSVSRSA